jgi:hypothetical protein
MLVLRLRTPENVEGDEQERGVVGWKRITRLLRYDGTEVKTASRR